MDTVADTLLRTMGFAETARPLGLTRRQFMATITAMTGVSLTSLLSGCSQDDLEQIEQLLDQIRKRPVRQDIATLATDDPILASYRNAITAMRGLPSSDPRNWQRQADLHRESCRHRSWLFLPWHRAYVLHFELICRKLSGNPSFALPYWNWTANPVLPAAFRDTSSPLFHAPRASRSVGLDPVRTGPDVITRLMNIENFLVFAGGRVPKDDQTLFANAAAGQLEGGPHNNVHGYVGGDMEDPDLAARDPVFWLHHNRVDQLWADWNITNNRSNTNNEDWVGTRFSEFCDADGKPISVPVVETLLYPLLTYRFAT